MARELMGASASSASASPAWQAIRVLAAIKVQSIQVKWQSIMGGLMAAIRVLARLVKWQSIMGGLAIIESQHQPQSRRDAMEFYMRRCDNIPCDDVTTSKLIV